MGLSREELVVVIEEGRGGVIFLALARLSDEKKLLEEVAWCGITDTPAGDIGCVGENSWSEFELALFPPDADDGRAGGGGGFGVVPNKRGG